MIGAARNFASTAPVSVYSAFPTPSFVDVSGPPGSLSSGSVTVNVDGGSGSYAFAWIKLSGGGVIISDDTSQVVSFTASGPDGFDVSAIYRCTVSDGINPNLTVNVNTNFTFGESGGIPV